jgi:hypothetical protein
MANQGGVTNEMLTAVGREKGPDYMLKILPGTLTTTFSPAPNNVISQDSSITEVLNVVSYLCSTTRDGSLIDTANSVTDNNPAGSTIGVHDLVTGLYAAGAAAIGDTFIQTANPAPNNAALMDINTLRGTTVGGAVIPVGILRRTEQATNAAIVSFDVKTTQIDVNSSNLVETTMSNCVKQMINILTKTREIFGPKGWTALFNQVKGGGAGSKHAKRTHRQHRRRYSSKHY